MLGQVQVFFKDASDDGAAVPVTPSLEQRVGILEADVGKMKGILERLEPKITEILLTGAKQADLQKLQVDMAELKGRTAGIEGRFTGLEGRFAGLGDRIALLPSI